jgi:hypothetical protein
MKPLLTALFILLVSTSLAQQSDLQKTIRLKKGWVRIDAIMQEIYKQGSLKFSFNSQQINPSKKIQIKNERLTIGAILSQVEQTANVKFKVVGRHIVLLNQPKNIKAGTIIIAKSKTANTIEKRERVGKKNIVHKKKAANTTPAATKQVDAGHSTNKEAAVDRAIAFINIVGNPGRDTIKIDSLNNLTIIRLPALPTQLSLDTTPFKSQPIAPALLAEAGEEREKLFWISVGGNGSELSYINPAVRAGYKRWFALLSLEHCTCSPSYRWGMGIEQWSDRKWQLRQTITTATTAALYPAATLPEVLVKNRHYKWSTLLTRVVWNKMEIQVGPVVNVLHTRYFSNDGEGNQQKVAAGALLPETMDGDKVFTSTEAPYTLFNTYKKDRVANWKGWIGAELGIYYKLPFSLKKKVSAKSKS